MAWFDDFTSVHQLAYQGSLFLAAFLLDHSTRIALYAINLSCGRESEPAILSILIPRKVREVVGSSTLSSFKGTPKDAHVVVRMSML